MPVDLPLGQQLERPRGAPSAQSANFGSRPSSPRERGALVDRPLEPLLAHRDVEAGLAQRGRERAERVPVERLRRHAAAPLVDVARGRRPAELLAEPAQRVEQLLARREPARHEPGGALGRVPRAEVLDHRLRMHLRLRVGRELLHRRRAAEALGARPAARRGSARPSSACGSPAWNDASSAGIDRGDRPIRRFRAMQEW